MALPSIDPVQLSQMLEFAKAALGRGELELAERVCREIHAAGGGDGRSWLVIADVARQVGRRDVALDAIAQASRAGGAPHADLEKVRQLTEQLNEWTPRSGGLHVVRAWGQGFWSDVDHVLGQLLVAEITGRTPVVLWGMNSRFRDEAVPNAWENFFEPVSSAGIADVVGRGLEYFPPKWDDTNLTVTDNGSFQGPYSRLASLDFFSRQEAVTVNDFHAPMLALSHWIPPGHRLHAKSVTQIYADLIRKYLKPRRELVTRADTFASKNFSRPTIAVHVRGSDKSLEHGGLFLASMQYHQEIAKLSTTMGGKPKILLVTDWAPAEAEYRSRYGDRVIFSGATKTSLTTGMHFQPALMGRKLGEEVLMDALIASRCHAFVGLAYSNVSAYIGYLGTLAKGWDDSRSILIGPSIHDIYNSFLLRRA